MEHNMSKNLFLKITSNLSLIILCILFSCAGPKKLSKYVTDNIKNVSVSSNIYFSDNKPRLLQIDNETSTIILPATKFGLIAGGVITIAGIILSIDRKMFLRNLHKQIREAVGDTVDQIVKRNIFKEFAPSFDKFDVFQYADSNSNTKTDAEFIIVVNSFGYAIKMSGKENIYPYISISCYLIENPPIKLIEPSKFIETKSFLLEPQQCKILWEDKALSMGSALSVKDLLSYPAKVEENMKEACKNTVQVIFCSMIGIKAY